MNIQNILVDTTIKAIRLIAKSKGFGLDSTKAAKALIVIYNEQLPTTQDGLQKFMNARANELAILVLEKMEGYENV